MRRRLEALSMGSLYNDKLWGCTHIQPEQSLPRITTDRALTSRGSSVLSRDLLPHANPMMATPVPPTAHMSPYF